MTTVMMSPRAVMRGRWQGMIQRCHNPNSVGYAHYGGRGISVCDRWRRSFEEFFKDMGAAPYRMTIDRINNDGNYEPGNVRWATWQQQARNKRNSKPDKFITMELLESEWKMICGDMSEETRDAVFSRRARDRAAKARAAKDGAK